MERELIQDSELFSFPPTVSYRQSTQNYSVLPTQWQIQKEKKKDMSLSVWKLCYTPEKEITKISLRDVMEHLQQKNLSNFSSETVAQWTWYSRNSGDND